ncbi:MAG TPA: hypothetical protein VFI13_10725 [Gemmatimonadales bacterium]|nr:hypothetical protein [Gemmatimonadales bacterium]
MAGGPFLALVLLALLPLFGAGSRRAVGWGIAGGLLISLGVAAAVPDWDDLVAAPATFVAVSAGLAWLGLGVAAYGVWMANRAEEEFSLRRLGPVGANLAITAAALVGAYVIYGIWPLLFTGSWRGIVAALGLAGSGIAVGAGLSLLRVADGIRWLDARWLAPHRAAERAAPPAHGRILVPLGLVLLAVALLSAHLFAFAFGALGATVVAYLLTRPRRQAPRWPVQALVAGSALLVLLWAVWTIAGSEIPLRFPGILETPFSDAAEMALALVVGLGAWALLGLWPFHGAGPGSLLAAVAGALLIRWGAGLIPAGMAHAAPIFALVVGVSALHAAATGRTGEYVAGLGVLAVLGGSAAAWGLLALASVLAALRLTGLVVPVPGLDRPQLGGIALLPLLAWGLPSMLTGETFVTVFAIACGVALFRPGGTPAVAAKP